MDKLIELLEMFKPLVGSKQQSEQTLMQISGYPRRENVYSSLLCFFLDTEKEHGFRDLFVRSLLECTSQAVTNRKYHTEYVDTECQTEKNNRVDIVFETDTHVVGIENKIDHVVNNNLCDYEAYIEALATESGKSHICILLTLKENTGAMINELFYHITYKTFIKQIKKNLGQYVVSASTKWIVFLNDFIKTLENLQEVQKMDKELLSFFNDNWEAVESLLDAQIDLDKFLKNKVKKSNGISFGE